MSDEEHRIHIGSGTGGTGKTASSLDGPAAQNLTSAPPGPELAALRQLTALSRAVAQAESFDDILQMAAHQAATMLGADQTVLILIGDDGTAHVRATYGVNPALMGKLEGALNERFIQQLESVLVGTASRAFMAVPLIVQREVTGLLAVVRDGRPSWTAKDEAMLAAVADQSAAPIEIARLSEEVRQARLVAENVRLSEAERLARAELEIERARLATVLDNIPSGVVLVEAPAGRVTFVNRAVAQLLRLPDSADLDKAVDVLYASVRPDGRPYTPGEWPLARALAHGETIVGEDVQCVRGDGTSATFSVNAAAIRSADDGIVAAVGTFSDVTSRRRIDQHLRQVQQMNAIGRLAGGVAHEANNQMQVVLAAASFVLRRTDLAEEVRQDVRQIQRAAERTAAVTAQLLAFSRRQVMRPEVLALDSVVADLAPVLRRVLGETSTLEIRTASGKMRIRADRGQLEQVLLNLAMNARDAMPQGGRLTVETRPVVLGSEATDAPPGFAIRPGPYLLLAFSDTGHGIDQITLTHLFEPFFTTKAVGKGTGLGLATVYGIVKQSDGYVWATSEPGRGATFMVYLPTVDDVEEPPAPNPPTAKAAPGEVILVVEDEPAVLMTTVRVLREDGYHVLEAANGRLALDLLEHLSARPDLLVTDVAMPELDGPGLAVRLRGDYPRLPILFMSGYLGDEVVQEDFMGADSAFLLKPFAPATLTEHVRSLLDKVSAS